MTTGPVFGRLSDVEARKAWPHEAHAFTPWLSENLDRLQDVIGIAMELSGREVSVGRYSADIVARSILDDRIILIENQLERSDHSHLGQIMTYLAGTEARIVIWIAPGFSEEHLSAIRWLNQHSHEEFSFFAVRLRVVQIENSPFAPLFEVLEKPNTWERSLQHEVRARTESSGFGALRSSFWSRYAELFPDLLDDKAAGPGGSNRWRAIPGRPVLVSRYLASGRVGIFYRGLHGMSDAAFVAYMAPYADAFERELDAPPTRTLSFHTELRGVTDDPATWDEPIRWLEQQTRRYLRAASTILPEDAA